MKCVICIESATDVPLCLLCLRAYRETDGEDMLAVVEWAANRARRL